MNLIRDGVGLLDVGWLKNSIVRKVGDGRNTLFWEDPWLDGVPLAVSFSRLFELTERKLVTVEEMFYLGWGREGAAWQWRRRLFAWEEELVVECVALLSPIVLQVGSLDRWVWKLHSSQRYTVNSAYRFLTAIEGNPNEGFHNMLWLKAVPLKVNIFVWRLFLNRLATKDNLYRRRVLDGDNVMCSTMCGGEEDRDHLFFRCDFYGRLWLLVSEWIGIATVSHGDAFSHSDHFGNLGGFSHRSKTAFAIIWIAVLFVIWKDRNNRIFNNQVTQLVALAEKVKLQTFWWLKANFILFDFDYPSWRRQPLVCLQAVL